MIAATSQTGKVTRRRRSANVVTTTAVHWYHYCNITRPVSGESVAAAGVCSTPHCRLQPRCTGRGVANLRECTSQNSYTAAGRGEQRRSWPRVLQHCSCHSWPQLGLCSSWQLGRGTAVSAAGSVPRTLHTAGGVDTLCLR